jgi:predicted nucleic acid-binding Zn ribbon protein
MDCPNCGKEIPNFLEYLGKKYCSQKCEDEQEKSGDKVVNDLKSMFGMK